MNRFALENLWNFKRQFRTCIALTHAVFFSSSFVRMIETFLCGQNATGLRSHSGPDHHKLDSIKLRTDVLLDAKSAGLNSVGTCFQSLGEITSIMSDTWFDTNMFQRRGSPDGHAKVIVESDHACIEDTLNRVLEIACKHDFMILAAKYAAHSFNFGILIDFSEATFVLHAWSFVITDPSSFFYSGVENSCIGLF